MYLYRVSEQILLSLTELLAKHGGRKKFSYEEVNSKTNKGLRDKEIFLHALISLSQKQYIHYLIKDGLPHDIELSEIGLTSLADQEFKKKQNSAVFNAVRDILVTLSGVAVAIATCFALFTTAEKSESTKALQSLQEEQYRQNKELLYLKDTVYRVKTSINALKISTNQKRLAD